MGLGGQQTGRIGMGGTLEDLAGRAMLDEAAHIHDRHFVADMANHGEIMGDDEIGEAELALQPRHQVQDLALDRDVEARRRLVGDDELGREGDGPGDADAARLAAGELVGIAPGEILRQPHQGQEPSRLGLQISPAHAMDHEGLGDQGAHRAPRAQARDRVLEHHRDIAVIGFLAARIADQRLLALEAQAAAGNGHQPGDGPPQRALARAALPHQGQGRAAAQIEGDVEHRIEEAIRQLQDLGPDRPDHGIAHMEIGDLQQVLAAAGRSRARNLPAGGG